MATEIKATVEGMLLNWLKDVGEPVKAGQVIAEFEADKATVEVEAPADGVISAYKIEVGETVPEGTVIAILGAAGEAAAPEAKAEKAPAPAEEKAEKAPAAAKNGAQASTTPEGRIKASPLARRIADDKGIDLAQVAGTGPGGRIVKEDVEGFTPGAAPAAEKPSAPQAAPAASLGQRATYGPLPQGDDVEIIEISKMRRIIAENTILSKQMTPHFYTTVEVNVEELLRVREELNANLKEEGIKISVNDMIVKAVALALRKFPNLNTHYYGDKLVRYKRVNVGIAVALPNNGLLNVVAQDADKVALSELAITNKAMFERAREGKVKPNDLKGATFTVSNLGPYDVESFSAIISPPEAGILAVSSARKIPVVLPDGSLGVGQRMKMTLSVDHRVSDGAEGAQFMFYLRGLLEIPMRLLV